MKRQQVIKNGFLFFAAAGLLSFSVGAQHAAADDYRFETSAAIKKTFYSKPSELAVIGKDRSVSGAWGRVNSRWDSLRTGLWYIEEQRHADNAIIAGVVGNDEAAIERGFQSLEWGLQQQQPDGSFDCLDAFHSTSFFIEAAAHSCLLIEQSRYKTVYAERIQKIKNGLEAACAWLLQPAVLTKGLRYNKPYTHRGYLVAAAFGEAGVLCGRDDLIARSRFFIEQALAAQDSSGYNPERNGYDCSYHAVGLLYAHRYYDIVADEACKLRLQTMFYKAMGWLLSRINEDGVVDTQGNTRTGMAQEKQRDGEVKNISYRSIANVLFWWSWQSGQVYLDDLAKKVYGGGRPLPKRK